MIQFGRASSTKFIEAEEYMITIKAAILAGLLVFLGGCVHDPKNPTTEPSSNDFVTQKGFFAPEPNSDRIEEGFICEKQKSNGDLPYNSSCFNR